MYRTWIYALEGECTIIAFNGPLPEYIVNQDKQQFSLNT